MSSGKILENYQINNYLDYDLNDQTLSLNRQIIKSQDINAKLEKIMKKIYKIHWLLKKHSQLSNTLKLDYCKIERALMIDYLKHLIKEI